MKRYSELTFNDILKSNFASYTKIVWNGKEIYADKDDGLYINYRLIYNNSEAKFKLENKYRDKHIYNFYCRVIDSHHTELYIEGE